MSYPEIAPIRRASREMVRRLGLIQGSVDGSPMTTCHAVIEIARLGEATPGELAAELCVDKSSASRIVAKLEKDGLVARAEGSSDKRTKTVFLTEQGKTRLTELNAYSDNGVEAALRLLRPEERQTVMQGLDLYARALTKAQRQAEIILRPIEPKDNPAVAGIVRQVLTEYGANKAGFAFEDPEVDDMHATYAGDRAAYYVLEKLGRVIGGGGYSELKGGDGTVCELQKMYFLTETRGLGIGARIIEHCIKHARESGYTGMYLETLTHMDRAQRLYQSFGFHRIDAPMGSTGHCGCDRWYFRSLVEA